MRSLCQPTESEETTNNHWFVANKTGFIIKDKLSANEAVKLMIELKNKEPDAGWEAYNLDEE